jgi:DNA-nicking Smr family endonuclease
MNADDDDEPFVVPVTGELDLHAFAPRDVVSVVEEYLLECRRLGLGSVRIAHGRGKGVQRAEVRRLISRLEYVLDFDDAPPVSGGWGATIVHLRVAAEN